MPAPTIFRSTDGGAPELNGLAGSLIDVLDYCLVSGLGWSADYTGTNQSSYRAPTGVRDYLWVDDNNPVATAGVRLWGYETMSAAATGTTPFPTSSQSSTGCGFSKSGAASSAARAWFLIGDDRTFYFLHDYSPVLGGLYQSNFMFGEIYSHKASDGDKTALVVGPSGSSVSAAGGWRMCYGTSGVTNTTLHLAFLKRSYSGTGSPAWNITLTNGHDMGNPLENIRGSYPWPNHVDGGFRINKLLICERGTGAGPAACTAIRGRYRGLWQVNHPVTAFEVGETFDGIGELAGKSFILLKFDHATSPTGQGVAFETTAWDTSS